MRALPRIAAAVLWPPVALRVPPLEAEHALLSERSEQTARLRIPALIELDPPNQAEDEFNELADEDEQEEHNHERLHQDDDVADPAARREAHSHRGRDDNKQDGGDDARHAHDEL